jgi:hypothetical protein
MSIQNHPSLRNDGRGWSLDRSVQSSATFPGPTQAGLQSALERSIQSLNIFACFRDPLFLHVVHVGLVNKDPI